jgi:hypothetical protein
VAEQVLTIFERYTSRPQALAECCKGLVPNLSDSIIEYETETACTIASLLFSGTAERYPDISWRRSRRHSMG